ncbi:MAG: undecaprenyl/decaprenyl-phosphate alpha-N-acetylglucosaminyl 1-phosphate transferase, partial [Kiritimatiellae bacterium]|nr:undecaprenyl/decaprenyl-phosphate alpha-N-acetylglucosaminyl 1-phosphate transferase [Kiritimatiellia bacterium]
IGRVMGLSAALVVVGLADDRFGLPPFVKLLGQMAVALGAFFWCGAGLHTVPFFAKIPVWLDCALTTFWIVGAVNAFNLIDGMDGLATGLALIAAIGMGGALAFIGYPQATLVYLAFAGACLAFLRYNFHPASVFLGDTGSMYIGFLLSVLPLVMKSGDSFFVSIGVPILAMGVPIFDTALAIVRRSIRAVLSREGSGRDEGNTHVMRADTDHLHHRILRKFVSQRKAAFALYALAAFFVSVGFGALALRDRAAGLFIVAFVVGVVIVVRDMRRIELWDAGRLLNAVAHDHTTSARRRRAMLAVPFYVATDALLLVIAWFLTSLLLSLPITMTACHTDLPLHVVPVFFGLVFFRA